MGMESFWKYGKKNHAMHVSETMIDNSPPYGLKGWSVLSARLGVGLLETPLPWHATIIMKINLLWLVFGK